MVSKFKSFIVSKVLYIKISLRLKPVKMLLLLTQDLSLGLVKINRNWALAKA
jgi:hypothetical protein